MMHLGRPPAPIATTVEGGFVPETLQEQETVLKEIRTAIRHSAVYGLGNVLAKIIGFLMIPFYTHYLSPGDYGVLEILDLSISLLGMFLTMGMTAAVLRSYAAAETEDEKKKFVSTALVFVAVTAALTSIAGLSMARTISAVLVGPKFPVTYLLLSFGSFILSYITNLPRTYLRALEASGAVTIVDSAGLLLMLALNIYFIAVIRIGLVGVLLSSIIVAGIQCTWLTIWVVRKVGIRFSRPHLRQMVKFGWPLMFSNLAIFALNFSDRFFLQHLQTIEVVGVYAVGYKFGFMMNYLLVQPFYVMWQSRMYLIHAQPDHPKIFSRIFVLYALILTYAGLALSMLSPEITRFMLDPKFSSSQNIVPPVALAYVFWGLGFYAQLGMFLTSKTNLIGIISAIAAVLNLILNYVLVLHYGMLGAAWATVISFLAIAAGSYICSQRVFHLSLGAGRVAMILIIAIGLYLLGRWWHADSLGIALLVKGLLLAVFPVILWRFRILSPAEVATLVSAKHHILARMSRLAGLVFGRTVNV